MTPGEALDQRIGAMERSVSAAQEYATQAFNGQRSLTSRVHQYERDYKAEFEAIKARLSALEARWHVNPDHNWISGEEAARLRRIERAARALLYLHDVRADAVKPWDDAKNELRAALDGETK